MRKAKNRACVACGCGIMLDLCASNRAGSLSKKSFNADSPSFTPSGQNLGQAKKTTLSSQAANAAPFTPRGVTGECGSRLDPSSLVQG